MRRRVTLIDAYGDTVYAVEHWPTQSDMPSTYTVNGRRMFWDVWAEQGWVLWEVLGEWEP
jgi:hypothetical protein